MIKKHVNIYWNKISFYISFSCWHVLDGLSKFVSSYLCQFLFGPFLTWAVFYLGHFLFVSVLFGPVPICTISYLGQFLFESVLIVLLGIVEGLCLFVRISKICEYIVTITPFIITIYSSWQELDVSCPNLYLAACYCSPCW